MRETKKNIQIKQKNKLNLGHFAFAMKHNVKFVWNFISLAKISKLTQIQSTLKQKVCQIHT